VLIYLVRRILWMGPVFFFIALVSFGIVSLFPGDFYTPGLLGALLSGASRSEAYQYIDALRVEAGIDKPWIVQFWIWFQGIVTHGDFGVSWRFLTRPENGLWWTLVITGSSMIWGWLLGIPIGILSAVRQNTWIDHAITGLTYLGFAFPPYVWGTIFFLVVNKLVNPLILGPGVWGVVGYELVGTPLTWYKVGSHILHLLPAWAIIGAPIFAMVVRQTRVSMIDTMNGLFVTVARGKGLTEYRVLFKHALRNALNPLTTIFGLSLPSLITGSILLGPVLGMPTFGQFLLNAVRSQQQQLVTAALLFYASFLLFGNLIGDLLLALVDPRIRFD